MVVNVGLQPPNSLLHDGHRWSKFTSGHVLTVTRDALRQAPRGSFFVHASYLFAGAAEQALAVGDRLQPVVDAALEAEDLVLRAPVAACVVRLGYLYGPGSRDLRSYRRAFLLRRPYWAGPKVKQRFVHTQDAAQALLLAARRRPVGRVFHAADNQPVPFGTFMDHFARLIGNPLPLHLPRVTRSMSRIVVSEAHMQMVELDSAAVSDRPRPPAFQPRYATYRSGLRQAVEAWRR
ncbi:MAG: hypothetical protein ABR498_01370 [Candidatus Dormibacteria bacterium]